MKPKKPNPNMVKYLERLTVNEKAVICFLANTIPPTGYELTKTDFHQGLLPFLPLEQVVHWLKLVTAIAPISERWKNYRRIALGILAKMQQETEHEAATVSFLMKLNPQKVYRRFGAHPERGKPMPFLPKTKVTVGQKWSLPKKQYVNDTDVLVSPCVMLKNHANGLWEVQVNKKCRAAVESWLLDNCM